MNRADPPRPRVDLQQPLISIVRLDTLAEIAERLGLSLEAFLGYLS